MYEVNCPLQSVATDDEYQFLYSPQIPLHENRDPDGYLPHMSITAFRTYLWFDDQALDAAEFYVSIFPGSRITATSHYRRDAQRPEGSILTVDFEMFGQSFAALNGGPQFPHSEAVSFQVQCETQDEIDRLWTSLTSSGGEESMCGWCKDRFGVSWQVTPRLLHDVLTGDDDEAADRAFVAMMKMGKIDIETIRRAANG